MFVLKRVAMKSRKVLLASIPLLALGLFPMWMLAGWVFGADNNAACYNASAAQESCQVRDVSGFSIISPQSHVPASDHEVETSTVEEVLEDGLDQLGLSPAHIVVRGTGQSDSIRCEWHGVARTTEHREGTIRYWLGLDDNDDLPSASDAKTKFMTYVHGMSPKYQETWAANLDALAKGGMTKDILFLACYIDYTTQEYILGSGSGPITVGYDQMAESTSLRSKVSVKIQKSPVHLLESRSIHFPASLAQAFPNYPVILS